MKICNICHKISATDKDHIDLFKKNFSHGILKRSEK